MNRTKKLWNLLLRNFEQLSPKSYFWRGDWTPRFEYNQLWDFLMFPDFLNFYVRQLVSQLVCKVYYTRNQLPFYFRWTKRILKYCILPLYYFYYCSLLQILLLQCGFCYLDGDKTEYTYFDKFFNLFFDLLTKLDTKLSSRNVDDL